MGLSNIDSIDNFLDILGNKIISDKDLKISHKMKYKGLIENL